MKLEDKEFLAEWMGWELRNILRHDDTFNPDFRPRVFFERSEDVIVFDKESKPLFYLDKWNPDNPKTDQFKEVWNKLKKMDLITELKCKCWKGEIGNNLADAILNDLPKVMDAVLEVLREGGK